MGVLADLVPQAQPALVGGGCAASATEGASWEWRFIDVTDDSGTDIDLTGVTGNCDILTAVGGSVVVSPTFAGAADGSFTLTVDEAATAGLATGLVDGRRCVWAFSLDDGDDVVQVWAPGNSRFLIRPGA